jgi:hypothetical protein
MLQQEVRKKISKGLQGREVPEETRQKISKSNRETWSKPEKLEEHSELMREVMHRPEVRERLNRVHRSERWSQRMREQTLRTWADPVIREQRLIAIRAVTTNPEWQAHIVRRRGPNHPNWNGGTSNEDRGPGYTKKLRLRVRQRDDFRCQVCGISEEEVNEAHTCHHIDYIRQNSFERNLVSICSSCHGKTNRNREYWQQFFAALVDLKYADLTTGLQADSFVSSAFSEAINMS